MKGIPDSRRPEAELARDEAVRGMFGRIARFYDLLNHLLSLGIDHYWRRALAAAVRPRAGDTVLDLAAGTLDVALAIARKYPDVLVPAMDFCEPMLALGKGKLAGPKGGRILPIVADARALPLPEGRAGGLTMAFGIRNIEPRGAAFSEMLRVLRPGGRACILEFGSGREKIMGGVYNFYLDRILPKIGRAIAKDPGAYAYLARTIDNFPAASELAGEMRDAGFANVSWRRLTFGIVCLHVGEKPA